MSPIIFGEIEIYNLTTYDNYFKGTGSVASGTITDAGVGVDTTSCEFTNDGGVTWTNESSWETDHCVMYGTAVDGVSYTFAFRVKDKLDNNKTSLYSETYTGDLSSPITTISGTTTSWSNTDVNITLTCDDNLSGCQITYYRIDDGAWFNYQGVFMISNDGNHHIDYYSKDNIGNTESLKIGTIAIDQTAPVTTDNSDNSWHSGTVNVTLTPTDSASGIMNTYYCISDTNDCTPTTIGTVVPVTCETENICTKYVRYFSTDYADNNESIKTSNQVKIDSSYPIVDDTTTSGFTIYNNYITGTGKVIGGYVHDDNGSEVNTSTCEYTINGNIWLPATWVTDHCESGNITITNAATYIFNTRITNNVGLIGYGTPTITYTGDTQAPAVGTTTVTGFSIYNNFINHSGIVVSGTATDSGSGINTSTCLYSVNDGNTWQQGTWMSTHCESPTFSVSGDQKIFKTRVSDNLGNIGTGAGTQTYTVDEVVPSTTAIGLNSSWNNTDVNITLTCDDGNGSGCKNSYYKINNGDYTEYTHMITLSGDGNILFNYRSVDNVDNNEIANTSYIAIDKTPPITTDNSDTSWHGENLNITLTPYDATSGINHTYYCIDETDSCNPTTLGIIVNITCPASSICQKYVRYYSTDMADNNESTKTSNLVKIDRTYPIIGQTTTSGFSISGNYIKGAGKVIGGTIIDTNGAGLDTNSCEYTTDGFSWYPGTYVTNHCESGDITVTDGTIYSFNTRIEDTLGRLATGIATINYTGDTLSPTVGNTTISDFNIAGLFITGTGTISAYASDSGVGIDYCEYTTNGSDWFSATWNASSGQCSKSITIANEATYAFNLRIIDKLSNTRNALSTTIYTGDTASPVTSIINDSNSWRKGTQILYLTCDDGSGSGCGYSYYTLNDTGKTYQYYDSIVFSDDGNHELDYYSNDKVGNYETQKATYVAIDNVSPTTTDNSDNLWHATDRNITLTSHDELSGVKNTYYCVDTQNACTPNTIGTLVSVTCSQDASCFKYIRYFSEDNADNNETTKFAIVKIDKAVPEVGQTTITGFTISGSHIKGTGRVIGGFTQDEDMNTSACQYTIDGINWLTATWVTDHCESGDINISDDVTYIFNTRMTSESGLVGYGTATIDYTGDLSGPSIGQTSFLALQHSIIRILITHTLTAQERLLAQQ